MSFSFQPIGLLHSCFKEKFGIPRQPGLVAAAEANLELLPPYNCAEALEGLEGFSHIWILFVFHQCLGRTWKPKVRPPRLGGNRRLGVFATRSGFRPNPLGISVVELVSITRHHRGFSLHLGGVDILDGTPVLDIKPYLPYADSIRSAHGGFASQAPVKRHCVDFSANAEAFLAEVGSYEADYLRRLIVQILENDPRPPYLNSNAQRRSFAMHLCDVNVRWEVTGACSRVVSIERIGS